MHYHKPVTGSLLADDASGIRIRLGTRFKSAEPVYWMPEDTRDLPTANLAIVGSENAGNTQMLYSAAIQMLRQKAADPIGLLLFDFAEKYSDSLTNFKELTGARSLRLYKLSFNPFALRRLEQSPQLPTHVAMVFADALARAYGLGALEKSTLVQSILSAYAAKGITSDPLTWNLTPPTFEDVYGAYCARPQGQHSDALSQVLDNLSTMELFDPNPSAEELLIDQLRGALVFEMDGYPEPLKHFVLGLVLEVLYAQMRGGIRTPGQSLQKIILIDGADRLLHAGSSGLEGLLAQGREYGISLLLTAQSMDALLDDSVDYRNWIQSWILHNVEDLRKSSLEFLLHMDIHDSELERLYQQTRQLRRLHSLIRMGTDEPILAEDLPFYEISSDSSQSYLVQVCPEPEPEPLAGMPLLDTGNLETLVTLEEEIPSLMEFLEKL